MKTELKKKWITALESGDYPKGNCALRRNGRFCCLGVLCEILDVEKKMPVDPRDSVLYKYQGGESVELLPGPLMLEIDLTFAEMENLADINDSTDTFEEVIEVIRQIPQRKSDDT